MDDTTTVGGYSIKRMKEMIGDKSEKGTITLRRSDWEELFTFVIITQEYMNKQADNLKQLGDNLKEFDKDELREILKDLRDSKNH